MKRKHFKRWISALLAGCMLAAMLPGLALAVDALPESVTVTAGTAAVNEQYTIDPVSGRTELSFTMTASATTDLKGGVKFCDNSGTEFVRFKFDLGKIKIAEIVDKDNVAYTTLSASGYSADTPGSYKIVLLPAEDAEASDTVQVYQVTDGAEKQVGSDFTLSTFKLTNVERLKFFTDKGGTGTFTYTDISYQTNVSTGGGETGGGTETVIFSQDFEGEVTYQGNPVGTSIVEETEGGNKVLSIVDEDTSGTSKANFSFAGQSGEITISFKINVLDEQSVVYVTAGSKENSGNWATATAYQLLRLTFGSTTNTTAHRLQFRGGDTSTNQGTTNDSFKINDWTQVKMVLDTTTGNFSVYSDDTLLGTTTMGYPSTSNVTDLGKIDNIAFTTNSAATARVYIDDVTVTVPAGEQTEEPVDQDALDVAADKAALTLGDVTAVTENLTLPTSGSNGSAISWATSDAAVITADGVVTRPASDGEDATVTLTATITKGSASDTKEFIVTVKKEEVQAPTDAEIVAADKAALTLGDVTAVTENLTLPTSGDNGSAISWATSDAGVITAGGAVTRPASDGADATVTLTATIAKGNASDTKEFAVTVKKEEVQAPTDAEIVAADKEALTLGEDLTAITQDLTLPTSGSNGSTISWATSDASVITAGGVVTRPASDGEDATVTLTATITKGSANDTKEFIVTVKKEESSSEPVDPDEPEEGWPNKITVTAGTSSTTVRQSVTTGEGNSALTFTVTASSATNLSGGVKLYGPVEGTATELVRFKLDTNGKLRIGEMTKDENGSTVVLGGSYTELGTYEADTAYTVKLVLIPATEDTAATVYVLLDGEQIGKLPLTTAVDVSTVNDLRFFTDSKREGTLTFTDLSYESGVAFTPAEEPDEPVDPDEPPAEEGDSWTPTWDKDYTFTTTADETLVTLSSGVTMQVGSGGWVVGTRKFNGGTDNVKYINCNGDGDSVSLSAKRGSYFKFTIPAEIEAGTLTVSLRLTSAGKVLNVLDNGEYMPGYPAEETTEGTDFVIPIDVEGGHTYTVYSLSTRPYLFGFRFEKVDRAAQIAALQAEVDAIEVAEYLGENSAADNVLTALSLPNYWTSPTFGACDIVWSADSAAVGTDGTVDRLAEDTVVNVTGHFSVQQSSYLTADKTFAVTVKAFADDAAAVAEAKEALTLGDTSAVKKDLTLPATGLHGTGIQWESSNADVVTVDEDNALGVIHPLDTSAQSVTLTATITRGSVHETKEFEVTVAVARIVDVNAWSYADADGQTRFTRVDGGKLHALNLTANQVLDESYKLKVEILNADGSAKSPAVTSGEVAAADLFTRGVGVSMPLALDLPMDSADLFRLTVYDSDRTYVTFTSSAEDDVMADGAKVYVVGDSTAAAYDETAYPQTGWAQVLERYFDGVEIVDWGIGGRSSLDYKKQTQYKNLQSSLAAGDYLLIQFGHNDSKAEDPTLYTDAALDRFADGDSPSYKKSMAEFVTLAWEKGAHPVFLTSISRRKIPDSTGEVYAQAVRELAEELSVPCVDLFADTSAWISAQGLDGSTDMFNVVKAQDSRFYYDPEYTEVSKAWAGNDSSPDYTHTNINGAKLIAMYAADDLETLGVPLGAKRNGYAVPETLAHYAEAVSGPMTPAQQGGIDFAGDGWKLQLPEEDPDKTGSVLEKSPDQLAAGYYDDYFYADVDDGGDYAVVFHSPVDGFKTANTSYARSELREMLDPTDKAVNWSWEGSHTLETVQRVTHVPASGQVITSQIHGIEQNGDNANPLVKVRYIYDAAGGVGKVRVELKKTTAADSEDTKGELADVPMGQKFWTTINVTDGVAAVTVRTIDPDGTERTETFTQDFVALDDGWKTTNYYFKVGNYIQDNTDASVDAYADVWVYSAKITHPGESIDPDEPDEPVDPDEPEEGWPNKITVTAGTSSTTVRQSVTTGEGNSALTFTVTASSATNLSGGVKLYGPVEGTATELVRFKLDTNGKLRIGEMTKDEDGGTVVLGGSYTELGTYEADTAYTVKLVLVPATEDTAATVYVLLDGGQIGKLPLTTAVDVSTVNDLRFFTDSKREGTLTFTDLSYESGVAFTPAEEPDEPVDPVDPDEPDDPDEPEEPNQWPDKVTVTAGASTTTVRQSVETGAGNSALTFTVTASSATNLSGGVKLYGPVEGTATELVRFKLDTNGKLRIGEFVDGKVVGAYTELGTYEPDRAYTFQLILAPEDQMVYVLLDGEQIGKLPLTAVDVSTINDLRFFTDSNREGTLTFTDLSYESGVAYAPPQEPLTASKYLLKTPGAWTLSDNGSATLERETLTVTAGTESSSNYVDVSGEGVKTLSFTVAVNVDDIKNLKGGVNFRDAEGNTVFRFKMQGGRFRLYDMRKDDADKYIYTISQGSYSKKDTFQIKLELYPATAYRDAYVKAYQDGEVICEAFSLRETGATLEDITRLYFFTDSNSAGVFTYTDMVYTTGVMTPAQTGAVDFVGGGWALTLPVEAAQGGAAETQAAEALAEGYYDAYFYAEEDTSGTGAIVFRVPADGYPADGASAQIWETTDWTYTDKHTLTAELAVVRASAGGEVTLAQIQSDVVSDLATVGYVYDAAAQTGKVTVALAQTVDGEKMDTYELDDVALGQRLQFTLQTQNGRVSVTVTAGDRGETFSLGFVNSDAAWKTAQFHFAVGSAVRESDGEGEVWVYAARAAHEKIVPKSPASNRPAAATTTYSDGSGALVETWDDGATAITQTASNGDTIRTQRNADGTTQITVSAQNGTAAIAVDANGRTTGTVTIDSSAAAKAQSANETLTLPVPQMTAGKALDDAPTLTILKKTAGELAVELLTKQSDAGIVPVAVGADGGEEIIRLSAVTDTGVVFRVAGDVTVKLVNNAKDFVDVPDDHWAAGAVDFASGRELLLGIGEGRFDPEGDTTRAAIVTILARLDGADTSGGESWYSAGMNWAVEKGVSDGTSPEALISREQFVTMLYRYGGEPYAAPSALSAFVDADHVSDWAADAMAWAVSAGVMNGYADGTLDPAGAASRAEAAALLMRYCMWSLGLELNAPSVPVVIDEETVAFEQDFDSETLGRSWAKGTSVVDLEDERVVELTDTDANSNAILNFTFPAQAGKVAISFRALVDAQVPASTLLMTCGSWRLTGKYSSNSSGEFMRVKTTGESQRFQYRGGDSTKTSTVSGGGYTPGQWFDVKVVVDTDLQCFDVYLNGELLDKNQPLSNKAITKMTNVDNITFMTEKSGVGHVYVDDVKVTAQPRSFSVWDASLDSYVASAGALGLLSDTSKWQLKQGVIENGALTVTADTDSASNRVTVSGEGSKLVSFTVVAENEDGAKGGVKLYSGASEALRFKLENGKFRISDLRLNDEGKVAYQNLGSYTADTAYAVQLFVLDKTDGQPARAIVYVDGQRVGEPYVLSDQAAELLKSVTVLNFFTDSGGFGTLTYTNMVYETGVEALQEEAPTQPETPVYTGVTPASIGAIDFLADGWKLQIPVENPNKAGSVTELTPQQLADGYHDEYFYVDTDENGDQAIVFHSPVQGYKTANTKYARSELRELLDPSDSAVNWTWQGTHTLVCEERVTHVPASGAAITSQIHGVEKNGDNANPLVKVRYMYNAAAGTGAVRVELKVTTSPTSYDYKYDFPNVALGQKYRTEIQVFDGAACVTISTTDPDGGYREETYRLDFVDYDPYWKETNYYFKVGNYIQDNSDTSDEAYADVWVYSASVSHSDTVEPVTVESISMDQADVSLRVGERAGLSVTVSPVKSYDSSVVWKVVEGDAVVVDRDGYITGVKAGTAVIQAVSVSNPAASATCAVTVTEDPAVEARPIFAVDFDAETGDPAGFTNEAVEITRNAAANTSVTVAHEAGNGLVTLTDTGGEPAKLSFVFAPQTTTTTLSFKVRIDALGEHSASSSDFGRLYIVAAGSDEWYTSDTELFRIRNSATGTLGSFSALTYVLTERYETLSMNADAAVGDFGEWGDVTLVVTPNNGSAKANTTDVYINGYPVALGVVNRNNVDYINRLDVQTGTDDVLTFSVDDVRAYTGIVLPASAALTAPASIALTRLPAVMAVMDSAQAAVEVTPADSYEKVTYSVVSGDAVYISEDGYVTAAQVGQATVQAASVLDGAVYAQQTITVRDDVIRPTALDLPATMHLSPGESQTLAVTVRPADATEKGLKFEIVSGTDVAKVDSRGVVTGEAVGTATLRVTSLSAPEVTDTVSVVVTRSLTPGEVIFSDSFESGQLDSASWTAVLSKDHTYVNVNDGAMTIIDSNPAANPKVTLAFTPVTGQVSIQFKVKIDGEVTIQGGAVKSTGHKNQRIAFGTGEIGTTANEAFTIRGNGTHFTYNTTGSTYVELDGDYNVADWNEVTLVTTIQADGPDTTDVYVNGVRLAENVANKVDYASIDKLCFSADMAGYAAYSIDDVVIWAGDYGDKPVVTPFADVPAGHWAASAVLEASQRGLMSGTGADSFSPDALTTRATVVTILARLDGADTVGGETWYAKGTEWAIQNGVSDGTDPDGLISREQLVTMLYRYVGQPATAGQTLDGFADGGAVSDWAVSAMEWAVEAGLMKGRTDGTLDPVGPTTRAEAAALLCRFCQWREA